MLQQKAEFHPRLSRIPHSVDTAKLKRGGDSGAKSSRDPGPPRPCIPRGLEKRPVNLRRVWNLADEKPNRTLQMRAVCSIANIWEISGFCGECVSESQRRRAEWISVKGRWHSFQDGAPACIYEIRPAGNKMMQSWVCFGGFQRTC